MADKYQDLIDAVATPSPGEVTPSPTLSQPSPAFNFSPTPTDKYQDLIDSAGGGQASPTATATAAPSVLPRPQPSMTPLTDQALKSQLESEIPTPPPWYMLGVSQNAPGLFEPLYQPERIKAGETQLPDAPFLPPVQALRGPTPVGMQQNLGAPPTHAAGVLEASMLNVLNGFLSGTTSARGLVTLMPPFFLLETAKTLNPYSPDNIYKRLRDADKTPAWSQERLETAMAIVTTIGAAGFMKRGAVNFATRWPEALLKPPRPVVPKGVPPEQPPPQPVTQMPGERGFVMESRREIPGVKYADVGPVRTQEGGEPVIIQHHGKTYAYDPDSGRWMERVETAEGAEARVLEPDADRNVIDELDFKLRKGGEKNAQQPGNAQVQGGPTPQRVETRPGGGQPPAGDSDNVVGKTQRGEAQGPVRAQPQPAAPPVAPKVQAESDVEKGKRPVARPPLVKEEKKSEDRISELEQEKAESEKAGRPFSLLKSQELKELKQKQVSKQPISNLLSNRDLKTHDQLQSKWSRLNFKFKNAVRIGDEQSQMDIARVQTRVKRQMRQIEQKLPGSDIYDVASIGGGPTGQTAGITAGSEDLSMVVLDISPPGGASAKTPAYENIPGELGQSGRRRALLTRLSAERHGTQFERISGIESVVQDPDTGIWTIRTKGLGKLGGGGKTYKARAILGSTGTKARGAPFPIENSSGQVVTRGEFDRRADQKLPITGTEADKSGVKIHLGDAESAANEAHAAGDGAMAAVGGANSAGQGALQMALSARKYNGKPVTIIVRGPRLSMSGYLQKDVYELKKEGWIKVMLNTVVDRLKIGKNGEKTLVLKTKEGDKVTGSEMPVDSVVSFTGGDPVTDWMPENFVRDKKGFIQTDELMRPMERTTQGAIKPSESGFYVGGSVRAGATNRMPPSEGEGVSAMEHIGEYITKLETEGKLPRWKEQLRDYFNRDEYKRQQRPPGHEPVHTGKPEEPAPLESQKSTVPDEPLPQPSPTLDWSDINKPPKPNKTTLKEHVASSVSGAEQNQQQRGAGFSDPADAIIARLLARESMSLSPSEQATLVRHRAALQQVRDDIGKRLTNQNLTSGQKAEAAATFEDLDSQIRTIDQLTNYGDDIISKPAADAWHTFRLRDYTPESMATKLEAAKDGAPLTPEETGFIKTQAAKLEDATTAIAARKIETRWKPGKTGDTRLRDLQRKQFKAKEALDHMIFAATLKSKGKMAQAMYIGGEILGLPRVLMTSLDLSAVLRQGGLFMMSHPIRSLSAFPDMIRAARSDKSYFNLMQDIRERPNADLYKESKLGITELTSPKLSEMEEAYMSRWAEKIPLVAGSQRAYTYYLNRLRADAFDIMARNLPRNGAPTPAQADAISNYINVFTGRGNPGSHSQAMATLNNVFFAPRYQLSRFQALIGQPLYYAWARSPEVRNAIAAEYGRTLAGMGVVYTLAQLMGAEVELNPTSTDFGKAKIDDTRFDLMSGLGQATVLMARFLSGRTKTDTGEVKKLYGSDIPLSQRTIDDVILTFTRSKLAPIPSALWNIAKGKKVTGEETDALKELVSMLFPMTGQDVYNSMRKYGVPRTTAIALASFFGMSVQDYEAKGTTTRGVSKPHRTRSHPSSGSDRARERSRF